VAAAATPDSLRHTSKKGFSDNSSAASAASLLTSGLELYLAMLLPHGWHYVQTFENIQQKITNKGVGSMSLAVRSTTKVMNDNACSKPWGQT
jgi:hypothetical protein